MTKSIPLFRPSVGEEESQALREVLHSGWLGLGPKTAEFEKKFAAYIGANHVIGTISGTSALDLAIKLLGPAPGDEILVPTITFVSSAHAILYNRCKPVFVDVERDTLNIDAGDLQNKITSKIRAIIVVHYSGRPINLEAIKNISGNIPIIEDCAHAAGARYRGRHVGTWGEAGAFSFHAVKNLAMGEGGALVFSNSKQAARALRLRWLGIDKGTWERTENNKSCWW